MDRQNVDFTQPQYKRDHKSEREVSTSELVDKIMDFDKTRLQQILKDAGLKHEGTKPELRHIIEQGIKAGTLRAETLRYCISAWEPWTHRHCFFISIEQKNLNHLRDVSALRALLSKKGMEFLLNESPKYTIPSSLRIDSVTLSGDKLVVTFVAPVHTYEYVETTYDAATQTRTKIEHLKTSRKMYMLEIDLKTGDGFLSIPAVQRGKTYSEEFVAIEKICQQLFEFGFFTVVRIESAIEKLMDADHSTSNAVNIMMASRRKVQIKSPDKKTRVFDETTENLEKALQGQYTEGAFYYGGIPERTDFRYKIYADGRLGIFADLYEDEFRGIMEIVLENLES